MADHPDAGFQEISRRFSELWQALSQCGGDLRADDARKILIDQVRDALDRGASRLDGGDHAIIANSFALEALVHDGAMAQVFRARHRDLGSMHAIKILNPDQAHDPVARQLLLREAEIGLSLRHPHIVATQALLRLADGRPALVFEWCDQSLADRLGEGPFSADDIIMVMTSVFLGLAAIHDRSLVHCDLSPANLMFGGHGFSGVKIADFGIAIEAGRQQSEFDLGFAGQPDFAAPEQMAGERLNHRADLHAAGRLLELLLGHCRDSCPETERLRALAAHLHQEKAKDRPENAEAALLTLRGLERCERDDQFEPGIGAAAVGTLFW